MYVGMTPRDGRLSVSPALHGANPVHPAWGLVSPLTLLLEKKKRQKKDMSGLGQASGFADAMKQLAAQARNIASTLPTTDSAAMALNLNATLYDQASSTVDPDALRKIASQARDNAFRISLSSPARDAANQQADAAYNMIREQARNSPAPPLGILYGAISTASMAASAYHGYKRNRSVGWAIWWGFMGAIFPVITPAIALAQGFGKPIVRGP